MKKNVAIWYQYMYVIPGIDGMDQTICNLFIVILRNKSTYNKKLQNSLTDGCLEFHSLHVPPILTPFTQTYTHILLILLSLFLFWPNGFSL